MKLQTKIAIANTLIELADRTEGETGTLRWGICSNFEDIFNKRGLDYADCFDAEDWLSDTMRLWPKFSGNDYYPVPAPENFIFEEEQEDLDSGGDGVLYSDEERADLYFQHCMDLRSSKKKMYQNFWGYNEYGALRRELLAFLLERIAKEL